MFVDSVSVSRDEGGGLAIQTNQSFPPHSKCADKDQRETNEGGKHQDPIGINRP